MDEYYWEDDRPRYYSALSGVRQAGEDLTAWLEYCAAGLRKTLEQTWLRIQSLQVTSTEKLVLRPLLDAGLVEKVGGKKTGCYTLRNQ